MLGISAVFIISMQYCSSLLIVLIICVQLEDHTMHMLKSELKSCRLEFVNWKDKMAKSKKKCVI